MGPSGSPLRRCLAVLGSLVVAHGAQATLTESVETLQLLETEQRVLIARDDARPIARVLVVFPGGDGALGLAAAAPPPLNSGQGYVSSLRRDVVRPGTALALVDSPSSQSSMPLEYRESAPYQALLKQLLAELRTRFTDARFYLLGYSNGAVSALVAAREPGVAGVILISGVFLRYADVAAFGAEVPLLVVHHEADRCIPPDFDASFRIRLRPTMVRAIARAYGPSACGPLSAHQFDGQEGVVADALQQWLDTGRIASRIR